jgi:ribonuclease HI
MKIRAGVGLIFISPLEENMRYVVRLHFPASNNMAEYEALFCGLRITIETGIKHVDVRRDSRLVIDQVMKNASCHDEKMEAYCNVVRALEDKFYGIELNHIPHKYNEEADESHAISGPSILSLAFNPSPSSTRSSVAHRLPSSLFNRACLSLSVPGSYPLLHCGSQLFERRKPRPAIQPVKRSNATKMKYSLSNCARRHILRASTTV